MRKLEETKQFMLGAQKAIFRIELPDFKWENQGEAFMAGYYVGSAIAENLHQKLNEYLTIKGLGPWGQVDLAANDVEGQQQNEGE